MGRPHELVIPGKNVRPSEVGDRIARRGFGTLNLAGNRESKAPGIGERVDRFMAEVFSATRVREGRRLTPVLHRFVAQPLPSIPSPRAWSSAARQAPTSV